MLAIKEWLYAILSSDPILSAMADIQYFYPNDMRNLPIITYQEFNQMNYGFADDVPFGEEVSVQIDVWVSQGALVDADAMSREVDRIMIGLFFTRDSSSDLFEVDTKIEHRVIRYRRTLTASDLT